MEKRRKEEKLEGWTKDQKFDLLEALKEVGSHNVDNIKELVPSKSKDEIKTALEFYRKKAFETPSKTHRKRNKMKVPVQPLAKWAKFITDSHGHEELQTETVAAVRLIAEFEDRPPAVCTEKIDFKKIYHTIADAMEGKPLTGDKYVMALLEKCFVRTADTCKALTKGTTDFKRVLQSACNPDEADVNTFFKPTEDIELLTLRHLITKKNYNPLNIPEIHLKLSTNSL